MNEDGEDREVSVDFRLPPELQIGVYANAVSVWHSPYEFTLDWAISEPVEVEDPDDPLSRLTIPARTRSAR